MLLAACLFGVVPVALPGVAAHATQIPTTAHVSVRFVDPTGNVQGTPAQYDAETVADLGFDVPHGSYYQRQPDGSYRPIQPNTPGISITRLIGQQGGVVTHVTGVDIDGANGNQLDLRAATGDLLAPATAGYPYGAFDPPVVSRDTNTGDLNVYSNPRTDGRTGDGVQPDGAQITANANSGETMTISIQLDGERLFPGVSGQHSVALNHDLTLTGVLPNASAYTWTWDFGDGLPAGHGVNPTHRFLQTGDYVVQATAEGTGTDRSSGRSAEFAVTVTSAQSSPPPTTPTKSSTPAAGPSHGTGSPLAPTVGPTAGSGPRIGGVRTDRPGDGQAGSTFASQPPVASVTAGATGDAPRLDGQVVGYLLGDAAAAARQQNPQTAKKALDDSAPAARDGRPVTHLLGWLAATVCLAALLLLGAGSERRRPSRRPKRS